MLRVLDIGAGENSVAAAVLGLDQTGLEYELIKMDANPDTKPDVTHDITKPLPQSLQDAFDLVVCSHVLEHLPREFVNASFGHVASALKNLGEVWVMVPSLEWAAAEVLSMRHTLPIEMHIFGGQRNKWDYHYTGFTLRMLRILLESQGLLIKKAYQSQYSIEIETKYYACIQNVAIGARYDGFSNPALAID